PAKSGDALCPDADRALVPVDVMTETRPHPARRPTAANSPPSAWDDTRATEVSERRATGVPRGTWASHAGGSASCFGLGSPKADHASRPESQALHQHREFETLLHVARAC